VSSSKTAKVDPNTAERESVSAAANVFSGGGEMGALMRNLDWSETLIGPVSEWPQSLITAVRIILTSRYAMFIWWGRELVNLYNDPYRAFLGIKHPTALGKSAHDVWAEIWDQIGPRTDAVLLRGESTYDEALLLLMERHGYVEETYFTFSYSPLPDDSGNVGGLFCAVTEETQQVIGERRLRLLREIASAMAGAHTPDEVCESAASCLVNARRDLPFSLIYLIDEDGKTLKRATLAGVDANHPGAPETVTLDEAGDAVWPFRRVIEEGETVLIEDLDRRLADIPKGEWEQPSKCAVLLPISQQGNPRPAGVLVAGLNPYRKFDDEFRGFVSLLANQIAAAIATAVAYEKERQRAETLAELDRAKTLFFSNVSHEFRTPLTLMLGPLEEVLSKARERLAAEDQENLAAARRNALRLLKLVNTLLDFSRIEAGRAEAVYEPTDLATFTAEIASVFRSAMEKAGLRFTVDCEPLSEPIYVDRNMWEKIVLNLLSNAFKYTFEGEVALTLKPVDGRVELAVKDTGVGIPENELPRVFERFHRIENTRARTHEGTGIGLALVQELVKLHGGSVRIQSAFGRGSTFSVSIPRGTLHLPADRIQAKRDLLSTAVSADSYVDEAQRWLPEESGGAASDEPTPHLPSLAASPANQQSERPLVVLADDNADMRAYLAHLLGRDYRVHAVSDGVQAIQAVQQLHPALVLVDVMMPRTDGFGVLRAIRKDASVSSTPVILLSARAGEESRVEGLQAGADDYLIKPFRARELLARVGTHIKLASLRHEAAEREALLRKATEENEERLRLAQSAAQIGTWEWDPVTGASKLSAELHAMFGTFPDEPDQYAQWSARVHPDDLPKVLQFMQEGRVSGEMEFEYRYRHPALGLRWFYCKGRRNQSETRMLGIVQDVTERKRADEALRTALVASQKLAAIVESSDDAIISKDLKGIVTSWNPYAEKLFGYTAEEMIGRSITAIIPTELLADEERILSTIARGERIDHFETVRVKKNGERIEVSLTISPVKDHAGKIIGAAKIARDITQRKKAERALHTSERLASVGRLAATVAHEINNPLEAVTNLIYLAKQDTNQPEVRAHLTAAEEELERISHLTKQTLGFYRETRGVSAMRLGSAIKPLISVFSSKTRSKAVEIRPEIKDDPEIHAVPGEIRQLLANLLSNSIDAVDGGGQIRIRVSSASEWNGAKRSGVRLTIADSGPGIPPDDRFRLFEPFFTTKKEVGTGLGLWVCKSIVEKHEGTIRMKSSTIPGRSWTAFSVFLPAQPQRQSAVEEPLRRAV